MSMREPSIDLYKCTSTFKMLLHPVVKGKKWYPWVSDWPALTSQDQFLEYLQSTILVLRYGDALPCYA
ncbi:hypothetical protein Tco_0221559 [Tanacetum coccineum]